MFQMVGTIRSAVKMAQMENQWQKKQQELNGKKDKKEKNKELTVEEKQIQRYEEDLAKMRESNKKSYISNKLMAGGELTASEIEYLKKNAPEILKEYEEIEQGKKAYKKQLKGCKSKEDVEKLKTTKMGEFMAQAKKIASNPNIPKSKKIGLLEKILKKAAVIQKEHLKFTQSLQYKNLPEKTEHKRKDTSEPAVAVPSTEQDFDEQDNADEGNSEVQQAGSIIKDSIEPQDNMDIKGNRDTKKDHASVQDSGEAAIEQIGKWIEKMKIQGAAGKDSRSVVR